MFAFDGDLLDLVNGSNSALSADLNSAAPIQVSKRASAREGPKQSAVHLGRLVADQSRLYGEIARVQARAESLKRQLHDTQDDRFKSEGNPKHKTVHFFWLKATFLQPVRNKSYVIKST